MQSLVHICLSSDTDDNNVQEILIQQTGRCIISAVDLMI